MNNLRVEHFHQAIEKLRQGDCLVGGHKFNMSNWTTCLCGSANIIAGIPVASKLPLGWASGSSKQKLHIAHLVNCTDLTDKEIIAEWEARSRSGWSLIGADLRESKLEKAVATNMNFRRADLSFSIMEMSDFSGSNFEDSKLTRVRLGWSNLTNANLRGANLRGANLTDATLIGADLSGANLRGANLRGANLLGACLRGTNLEGADLRVASLRRADLTNAKLKGANLQNADLTGTELSGATLADAHFFNTIIEVY